MSVYKRWVKLSLYVCTHSVLLFLAIWMFLLAENLGGNFVRFVQKQNILTMSQPNMLPTTPWGVSPQNLSDGNVCKSQRLTTCLIDCYRGFFCFVFFFCFGGCFYSNQLDPRNQFLTFWSLLLFVTKFSFWTDAGSGAFLFYFYFILSDLWFVLICDNVW